MRRVVRHFFTIISALSLLLCVVAGALWVRSAWHDDVITLDFHRWAGPEQVTYYDVRLLSYSGSVGVCLTQDRHIPAYFHLVPADMAKQQRAAPRWPRLWWSDRAWVFLPYGFNEVPPWAARHWVVENMPGQRADHWFVAAPAWLPIALLMVAPAAWARRYIKARLATRRGFCPKCGYDLRASPERCPECGTAKASRASADVAA